jgi:hypothetical protein
MASRWGTIVFGTLPAIGHILYIDNDSQTKLKRDIESSYTSAIPRDVQR